MSEAHPSPPDPSQNAPTVIAPVTAAAQPASTASPAQWPDGLPVALPARFGRYELLRLLGKGGMGAVYLARDTQLERRVALKIPHFAGQGQYHLRDRFLREARVAGTLAHPNLCPVYDCGEIDGVLYLTMAYLEGKPLARFIRPGQQLPARAVVAVVRQLALAMQEAHAKGIIHRDLKPANIMITPKKQAVIMDFGLARRTEGDDLNLTHTGLLLGTPAYMPPEQLNSDAKAMGPATDVYALGVILYELLAGRQPFQGPLGALMARIMTEPPPPPSHWRKDLDPALDAICAQALAKGPADRFASMQAFAAALGDYLRGRYRAPAAEAAPEPEPEPTPPPAVADAPLDEQDAAALFHVMAARPARPPRPSGLHHRRRRRFRLRLPEWLIPLTAAAVALGFMGWVLWSFFQYLDRRSGRHEGIAAVRDLDPEQVAEEQRRLREHQMLEEALTRWQANPADPAARQELDRWLNSSAGQRIDVPPEVNLGLGRYLILERDRWDAGLRRLMLSSEGPWRKAAELDLAAAGADDAPAAWVAGGDGWWQVADTQLGPQPGPQRQRLLDRAVRWYKRALPHLRGSEELRIRQRLRQVETVRRNG